MIKMDKEQLRKVLEKFTEKKDFMLNPDKEHIELLLEGLLENEKKHRLKLCPCRLRDGTRERDLELICPCNFKTHETWLKPKKGMLSMCICGLFVKRQ